MRDRHDIFHELTIAEQERAGDNPRYDIRQLSKEILIRVSADQYTWLSPDETRLTLATNNYGRYQSYDLYAQEKNDNDVHLYTYGTVNNTLQYKYPLFTHQRIENPDEVRQSIEALLQTGPAYDKVTDNSVENRIQKMFLSVARILTIEKLKESDPKYRTEMYLRYLEEDNDLVRKEIIDELYKKTRNISPLSVGPEQFELALLTDITRFKMKQKALTQYPEN